MKIKTLALTRFSAFKKASFDFSPGLNVLIGENGTGKSHLMKLLYAVLQANQRAALDGNAPSMSMGTLLAQNLIGTFRPDNDALGRLVFHVKGRSTAIVDLTSDAGEIRFSISTLGNLTVRENGLKGKEKSIFIPAREMFSVYEGFLAAVEGRELSFDSTYRDLCVALSAAPALGARQREIAALAKPLELAIGGSVKLDGGKFYAETANGRIEAHMLAEGMRKIASLLRLVVNGSLMQNGVLFWDEPEANLNPKLVTLIARILRDLGAAGVQVFIASHDYLLTRELSLASEYRTAPDAQTRFFALTRQGDAVQAESADSLADLAHNPILEEFAAHYDRESALFAKG